MADIIIKNRRGQIFTGATMAEARLRMIQAARDEIARRAAEDPANAERVRSRLARMDIARKRERQRIEHLVMGKPRPKPETMPKRPKGMDKRSWREERKRLIAKGAELEPGIEEAVQLRERYGVHGTPETEVNAALHSDCLQQMLTNGAIDREQKEYADEIANVYRSIEAGVAVSVASLEARVDQSRTSSHLVAESITRVRLHLAYDRWRSRLPSPRQMVLDMIVGDAIGYTVAAKRYGKHHRTAKRALIAALDAWPEAKDFIAQTVSADDIRHANDLAGLVQREAG
jgi:hypothetical protein